ncbi:hypothetical protein F2P56_023095 [Juglans regia]|nr:EG45-like domain containing protein isoform X2 [Juglans regia]KAF5459114.1 hypothetical protein F2P56_023095 [Juglans regia]
MSSTWPILQRLSLIMITFFLQQFFTNTSHGDVGTAARYSPPYSPTACYGSDPSQLPSSNLFAAAGDGIWDNGASCGRQYLVRCISASQPGTCVQGQTIQIRIIDSVGSAPSLPSSNGTTMVLSTTAFQTIANASVVAFINIEFQQ